jgi:uncharacterized protein (DUF427 family)
VLLAESLVLTTNIFIDSLQALALSLFTANTENIPKFLPTEKRVLGLFNDKFIFDTTSAKLVWEKYSPQYWIPKCDFLEAANFTADIPIPGIDPVLSTLTVTSKSVSSLVVPDSSLSDLAGYVKLNFKDLDAWYEEQAQLIYYPKDPFHRVDILPSGRHIRVQIGSLCLADTGEEGGVLALFETNLPARWYIPRTAIKWEYLIPSETHTGCPYKGEASCYSALINGNEVKDVAWWYRNPTRESGNIIGMLCFYPAKVDMWIDGKKL